MDRADAHLLGIAIRRAGAAPPTQSPLIRRKTVRMNDAAVVVRRVFHASRERLFRAWSEPNELIQWFSPEGYRNPSVDADVKPGGCFRIAMQKLPDEQPFFVTGAYRVVE